MSELFKKLQQIDCSKHTEKKNGLTYLSWAWAWQILNEYAEKVTYTVYENKDGLNYHTDGKTAWVKTGVTANGLEHIEYLPVMDYKNQSIPVDKITSFHVNTAIQRSLTKAIARHGLGLYIYAGEDLPQDTEQPEPKAVLSQNTLSVIDQLIVSTGTDLSKVLDYFKVASLTQLTTEQANKLVAQLKAKQ